jgi:glutathione synthase/RimK-type ligase-like ATP-grasp enzyme
MIAPAILLWGLLEDPTLRSVHDRLNGAGTPVVFLNHAAIDRTRVRVEPAGDLRHLITHDDAIWALEDFSAAYLRPYDSRDYGGSDVVHAARVHHLVSDWAQHTDALIINRPAAEASNHSKLAQANIIGESGFSTPPSIVTNDLSEIRAFRDRYGRVVLKSLSAVRSIVTELMTEELPEGPIGPALVQQLIQGINVRVHVIGAQTFASMIESDGIDYRYANAAMRATELPQDIAERSVALARRLDLAIAGVDLITTPRGDWYCLEVNPNPGFSVYDSAHDGAIATAVAELLASAPR